MTGMRMGGHKPKGGSMPGVCHCCFVVCFYHVNLTNHIQSSTYATQETKTIINVNETMQRELLTAFFRTAIAKTETEMERRNIMEISTLVRMTLMMNLQIVKMTSMTSIKPLTVCP
jgi:hypothetical protein